MPKPSESAKTPPFGGGCACGALRYQLLCEPMFVHCCHCTRCQRENGSAFAHHAMIEFTQMEVTSGTVEFVKVPTDSGNIHWIARCTTCRTALWNEHGSRKAAQRYLRVGTLDQPDFFPPQAHIYVRSKQAWLQLAPEIPAFDGYYDSAKLWPAASLARLAAAKFAKSSAT